MVKAINTEYNGYRFRSRLEARWAVFFDALGIKYRYEVEGFDLRGSSTEKSLPPNTYKAPGVKRKYCPRARLSAFFAGCP